MSNKHCISLCKFVYANFFLVQVKEKNINLKITLSLKHFSNLLPLMKHKSEVSDEVSYLAIGNVSKSLKI